MIYDDACWHRGNEFPSNSPMEYSGTHIALFLRWCFLQGWANQLHFQREPEATYNLIQGEITATEYLFRYCDGRLSDANLNEQGNAFVSKYYGRDYLYLNDYVDLFGKLKFVAEESAHDFEKLQRLLNKRLKAYSVEPSSTAKSQYEQFKTLVFG